ncbi:hypothetical protein M422DRAFT_265452 [Sphaerobolus stellatus SS14]|uniref:DRBM domain-containing protein n=1 Tax=Sphaerobolus stellatus (strain SS14) TaxID=990650 RepID=A0A0C9UD97_SPHS4|nr:hypothetical protein M422DRAFT_265452 [Sphaerobolus stellatus SS14]
MSQQNENRHIIILNNYMQRAHQLGALSCSETSTGPAHLPTWTVTYIINGQPMGSGTAQQKWKAKDTAARETLIALGVMQR